MTASGTRRRVGTETALLTRHHLGISQSDRIVWSCEELELPYAFIRSERNPATKLTPPAYRAPHPSHTAPVIGDDGVTLVEFRAISEYIIGKHGDRRLSVGPGNPEYANYPYWLHYANGSMMGAGLVKFCSAVLEIEPENEMVRDINTRYQRAFQMAQRRLGSAAYLAGPEFTAADIIMLFPLTTIRLFTPHDLSDSPNIRAYLRRIGERPAFQRAMAKIQPDRAPPRV